MELEAESQAMQQKRKLRQVNSRWLVYVVISLIIFGSAAVAGWAYIRYDRGLVFTAFTDKDVYSTDELVNVTVEFKNYGFDSVHLTFGTSAMASFSVYTSEDVPVCNIPIIALQAITEVTIKPGQSEEFRIRWNQLDYDIGTGFWEQVPPGTYYIVAGTLSREFHATALTSTFTISG